MAQGFIYILTNTSMPGLVKIGKTTNDSNIRATQLSSVTGVPEQFKVYKEYYVYDCEEAERYTHSLLDRVVGRPNKSREFFKGTPEQITALLDDALSSKLAVPESYALSDFKLAFLRLEKKELTLGCFEFESIFNNIHITESKINSSKTLQTAAGAYLACCYGSSKRPAYDAIIGSSVKSIVIEKAIKFAEEFESDPATQIIQYIRTIE